MNTFKKRLLRVTSAFLALSLSVCPFAHAEGEEEDFRGDIASRYISVIIDQIAEDYRFGADKDAMYKAVLDYVMHENPELLEGAIRSATEPLDNYSLYFSAEELNAFVQIAEQAYVGIGVTITPVDAGCEVLEVDPNGGAHAAGILPGDIIIGVDGKNVAGMDSAEVSVFVRGDENTSVVLTIKRGDEVIDVTVVRKLIFTETVAHFMDKDVAYIYISTFTSTTPDSLSRVLSEVEGKGVKKFIIDLRDNPGGELESVVACLELFVPKGKVITKLQYNNPKRSSSIVSKAKFSLTPKREIVILANEESASAAEMFAGTMQNLRLAKVVGQDTFGKGSMQHFMNLINPPGFSLGDIKLSVGEFTKPDGSPINGLGVAPDVYVKNTFEPYDVSTLTPMTISDKYKAGDTAEDVRAIEERLSLLGYFSGEADDHFDEKTHAATERFQEETGLFVYGVMDFTTQNALNDQMALLEIEVDKQYETAMNMLTKE